MISVETVAQTQTQIRTELGLLQTILLLLLCKLYKYIWWLCVIIASIKTPFHTNGHTSNHMVETTMKEMEPYSYI